MKCAWTGRGDWSASSQGGRGEDEVVRRFSAGSEAAHFSPCQKLHFKPA